MYKLHLILQYLRRRRIAWVSLIAVMLCTAMVLVVISVMGGWLRMFRASFQGLSGDVVVRTPSRTGFAHYEEIIAALEQRPEIVAAAPVIETYALINIDNQIRQAVRVVGLNLERMGRVNAFWESLYLQHPTDSPEAPLADMRQIIARQLDPIRQALRTHAEAGRLTGEQLAAELAEIDRLEQEAMAPYEAWAERERRDPVPSFDRLPWEPEHYRSRLDRGSQPEQLSDPANLPGMIVGTGVVRIRRDEGGEMDRWQGLEQDRLLPVRFLTLSISEDFASLDVATAKRERTFWIVDNSRTGVFQTDEGTIYVDFDLLQSELNMEARTIYGIDPDTFEQTDEVIGVEPARAYEVHVRLAPGLGLESGRDLVDQVVQRVLQEHSPAPPVVFVETWEAQYGSFLQAVEREKALVTTLFAFISVVAIFLIFCIFYMIVQEKIKDIGIIKSVGATNAGIAGIFLGYGAAIGIVGGLLGVVAGGLIVRYINEIHEVMGHVLGIQIWSAETYMFDRIPNTMNPNEVLVIVGVAIISSILGAVVPAMRAARLRPVEALRFE